MTAKTIINLIIYYSNNDDTKYFTASLPKSVLSRITPRHLIIIIYSLLSSTCAVNVLERGWK